MKSRGSFEFNQDHRTGVEWSALLKTAEANVSRWRAGKIRPNAETRKRIHAHGGPEPRAWDEVVGAPSTPQPTRPYARQPKHQPTPPPPKKRRKPRKATTAAVIAEADLWLAELEAFRNELPNLVTDAARRAGLLANAAKTLLAIGKLTGVGLALSQRQILDSPNWRLIEAQIIEALKPFGPDALRAVANAIHKSRGG